MKRFPWIQVGFMLVAFAGWGLALFQPVAAEPVHTVNDSGPYFVPSASTGRISGQVTDADTSKPLAEVEVEVYNSKEVLVAETKTNKKGKYRVDDLAVGEYRLVFCKEGYGTEEREKVKVGAGKTRRVNVTLTLRPGPPAKLILIAIPPAIQVYLRTEGKVSTSTLKAVVRDSTDQPVENGTVVEFRTNLGTFDPVPTNPQLTTIQATTVKGIAKAWLTSQTLAGPATVTAEALDPAGNPVVGNTTEVEFVPGPPATVTVSANPANILADGKSKSTITVVVWDAEGNNVADGTVVTITTSGGTLPTIPPDEPDLDPAANGYQVGTINGVATATLTSSTEAGRALITASAGSASGNTEVVFSSEVIGNITLGFDTGVTYTPSIWANSGGPGGSIGVIARVTTEDGDPVADGTVVKFRILDKANGRADGQVTPGTVQTVNGIAKTTVYSSDQAGVHVIRAEVYDAQGNVVLEAQRDINFTGNVHQIALDTSVSLVDGSLRQRTAFVVGVGEIYPHGNNRPPRPDWVPSYCSDNWYINQSGDGVRYRAQVLDENQLPVPDGTNVTFYVTDGSDPADLSVPVAPTRNGWTTTPEGWTGVMTGGTTCTCHTLHAQVFAAPESPEVIETYQDIYVGDTATPTCGVTSPLP